MIGYLIRRVLGMGSSVPLDAARLLPVQHDPGRSGPADVRQDLHALAARSEQTQARARYPAGEQYFRFLGGLVNGRTYAKDSPAPVVCNAPCLGYSFLRHQQVLSLITKAIPVTFWLAVGGFVIWIITGLAAGIYAALHRGKWQDRTIMGLALVGYSLPSFFIGLVLIFFVVLEWGLLPFPQWVSPTDNPVQFFQTMILPWIVIAVLNAAFYVRLTRNQVLETLGEDYVRTARAKGLRERTVVVRHALRAGLTPIVTAAGLDLAYLLGGAIITESIFSLPGMGSLAVDSVVRSDLPIIAGVTLVSAAFIIFANLVVDLLYAVVDPRVRVG